VTLFTLKYLASLVIFLTVFIPLFFLQKLTQANRLITRAEALTAGLFLGAGLLHLLPESIATHPHYPWPFFIIGLTLLGFLLMEHILTEQQHHNPSAPSLCALLMLCFHAATTGLALGVSVQLSDTWTLLIAILAHKWIESFAFFTMLYRCNWLKTRLGLGLSLMFAIMTPAGILIGNYWLQTQRHTPEFVLINALATGTFLYIGTLHGLKKSVLVERCCDLKEFAFVIIGYCIMALLAVWT
jgi:solute carrier family 39 (zinc transporter), member 1/2/3